ncbi:MAG: hypothetical protein U0175_06390 [Caldilineaceae bacterium]
MPSIAQPETLVTNRITQVCVNLQPFQSVEYDPMTGIISIITEWLIPQNETHQLTEILAHRREGDKLSVRRFDQNYKVALVKSVQL